MTDIYLETLSYSKVESNDIAAVETLRVDTATDAKINNSTLGSPSGTSTLDTNGKHNVSEIPFSSFVEIDDNTNEVTVVNPKQLDYIIQKHLTHTYDYIIHKDVTVIDNIYTEIAVLTTPTRAVGIYQITLSMLYTLNTTVRSGYFRFSLDAGGTWTEIRKEAKDINDITPSALSFPYSHPGGIIDIKVEAKKEDTGDSLTLKQISVVFESKDLT